jgi:hypothetical protein
VLVLRVFVAGNAPLHAVDAVKSLAAAGFDACLRRLLAFFAEPVPFDGEKIKISMKLHCTILEGQVSAASLDCSSTRCRRIMLLSRDV